MTSPYRRDVAVLRERRDGVAREIDELGATMKELAAARARLESERSALDEKIANRRRPLDQLRVAGPCNARWSSMRGDDRVRLCAQCNQNVYDLSALTEAEALDLLSAKGDGACVRFYRRADGRVMTSDCPSGARSRKRALKVLAGGGGVAAATFTIALAASGPTARASYARIEPDGRLGYVQGYAVSPATTSTTDGGSDAQGDGR